MKRQLKIQIFAFFVALLASTLPSKAQLSFSVSNSTVCTTTATNPIACAFTSTVSGTVYYSYSVTTANCGSGFYGSASATVSTFTAYISCGGPYTVYCNAINSSSAIVGSATASGTILSGVTPTVTSAPGNGGCVGSSFSLTAAGAGNYTWTGPGYGPTTGSSIVLTPTASGCYTVASTNTNGCVSSISKCLTIGTTPTLTINASQTSVCAGNVITVSVTGASTYSNGTTPITSFSGTGVFSVNPTSSTCYTITGNNSGCTSTAPFCVTVVPGPTVTVGASSGSVCLGTGVTFTAGGSATSYTWSVLTSTGVVSTVTTAVSYTPPYAGTACGTLIAAGSSGCNLYTTQCVSVIAPASLSVSPGYNICAGSSAFLSASGASSYSWSTGALTSSIVVTPSVSTCYTVTAPANACGGPASAVSCVSVIPVTAISVNGPTNVCAGTVNTFTASGASSYTWTNLTSSIYIGSGSVVNVSSSLYPCFKVSGTSSTGCAAIPATVCPGISPQPTITISASSSTLCQNSNVTLTASGAITYTWSTLALSNPIVVTLSSSTCYSVVGTNASGCTSGAVKCLTVIANPVVTISGSSTICPNSSAVLNASGASTYSWSNATTGNTTMVSPTINTCYMVTGTNSAGCSDTANFCMTVLSPPSISIAGSNTVCLGSSVTYTASGANSYTWSTGATASTLYALPLTSTVFVVTGSHTLNSCTSSASIGVTVNTACAVVWPGDANRDGVANSSDILELGLAASSTGPARSGASTSWTGQYANAWSGNVSTGWNKCHADCNGDGVVDSVDATVVSLNFALTHSFKPSASQAAWDIYLVPQQPEVFSGVWNVVDVLVGDASNPVSQLYGTTFDLDYDNSMVEMDSVKLVYNASFLNNGNQNINFAKTTFSNGKIYAATVRTDGNNVSGNGKIAEFRFKLKASVPENSSFNFGLSNSTKVSASGTHGTFNTSGAMNLNVNGNATGIADNKGVSIGVSIYPNPASNTVVLSSKTDNKVIYAVTDVTGRNIMSGSFTGIKNLDLSDIPAGTYFIKFNNNGNVSNSKLIVNK